ncbi:MAG: hypothetical protein ACTSRZ_19990, partial [Promethearchaeota archaeon]
VLPPDYIEHAYYKYYVFINPNALKEGWDRDKIIKSIEAEGIPCGFGVTSEIGREAGWKSAKLTGASEAQDLSQKNNLPVDHELGLTALMFQVHPTLNDKDIHDTIKAVKKVMNVAVQN